MGEKKKDKKLYLIIGIVVAIIIIKTIVIVNFIYSNVDDEPEEVPQDQSKQEEPIEQVEEEEAFFAEAVNILVVGTDERSEGESSRTDTIMVYHLDPINNEVKLLSIPRDTYVNIPGRGMDKINHAHAFGEIDLTIETVEEFLDVEIDYYARTNFGGFERVIDLIGGVTIDVEKRIKDIQPGEQTLDGKQALAYVRDRNDPMGDIARVKRQQIFIKALAEGIDQYEPKWKLISLAPQMYSNVKTNIPMKAGEELLPMLSKLDIENAEIEVIPGWFYNKDGISYWRPDAEETEQVISRIFKI